MESTGEFQSERAQLYTKMAVTNDDSESDIRRIQDIEGAVTSSDKTLHS